MIKLRNSLLFIVFKEFLPVEAISRHSETVIGVLLIGIGAWSLVRLYSRHSHGNKPHAHFHTKPFLYPHIHRHTHEELGNTIEIHGHSHDKHEHEHINHRHHQDHDPEYRHHHSHKTDYGHGHAHSGKVKENALSAFFIGTVHGFAGFSHLFALLPSLALPTLLASVIYVVAFAAGTIMTMVIFAFILGIIAFRSEVKQKLKFLKWFSFTGALLAIAIGILWIVHPI